MYTETIKNPDLGSWIPLSAWLRDMADRARTITTVMNITLVFTGVTWWTGAESDATCLIIIISWH